MKLLKQEIGQFRRRDGVPVRHHFRDRFICGVADARDHRDGKQGDFTGKHIIVKAGQAYFPTATANDGDYIESVGHLPDTPQLVKH